MWPGNLHHRYPEENKWLLFHNSQGLLRSHTALRAPPMTQSKEEGNNNPDAAIVRVPPKNRARHTFDKARLD